MKLQIVQNTLQCEKTLNHKGDSIMNNLTSQIGNTKVTSNGSMYSPIRFAQLREMDFSNFSVGVEHPIYDFITDNQFTLDGKRISLKKESKTRFVIGCVECPEYLVVEEEELENISCLEFVNEFLALVNSKIPTISRIAA
jgi:hypothetical protein